MTKEIALSQGMVALVDDDMYEYLSQWKWHAVKGSNGKFYAVRLEGKGVRKYVAMHRVVANTPPGMDTDHIDDNDTLNNQRYNLRPCTRSQNQANRGRRADNTSGYKGVTWNKAKGKWIAQIRVYGKQIHIGNFVTAEKAARAYDGFAQMHFGKFAKLNFPKTEGRKQ